MERADQTIKLEESKQGKKGVQLNDRRDERGALNGPHKRGSDRIKVRIKLRGNGRVRRDSRCKGQDETLATSILA